MTATRSDTTRLLLVHIPGDQRVQVVRKAVQTLNAESLESEISFVAALVQDQQDDQARQSFIELILRQIEGGNAPSATALYGCDRDLQREVVRASSKYVSTVTHVPTTGLCASGSADEVFQRSVIDLETLSAILSRHLQFLVQTNHELWEAGVASALLQPCLVLIGSKNADLRSRARDMVVSLITHQRLSEELWDILWTSISSLCAAKDAAHQTLGCSIWLRAASLSDGISARLLTNSGYWPLVVQGLRNGDSERRKVFLQILRASVDAAVRDEASLAHITARSHINAAPELIRAHHVRFCTVFETVVLGRYLNQVVECQADLDFLSSTQSAVQPIWLYTLLASSLDHKMQDANRKFLGAWVMRSSPRLDDPEVLLHFFRTAFLPWAMQGYLFTSTLRKDRGALRCQHGDKLSVYVSRMLSQDTAIASAGIDAITDSISGRHGNNFAYAMVYLMDGIGQAVEANESLIITARQFDAIKQMVGWIGLPEVARDHVVARFWKISHRQAKTHPETMESSVVTVAAAAWDKLIAKSVVLGEGPSAHLDGSIASIAVSLSRREANEESASRKCADMIHWLESMESKGVTAEELVERLDDIWSDLEYLESPKGLLINLANMALDRRLIQAVASHTLGEDTPAAKLTEIIQDLRKLASSRSYLLAPFLVAFRRAVFDLRDVTSILDPEELVVSLCESPPTPTLDSQLEDATSALIPGISPELEKYNYTYYFGKRESFGFAALLDLASRLGPELASRIFRRLLQLWMDQKIPPPTVSPWKKIVQLQVLLLCSEQILPTADVEEVRRILKDLYRVLSIEPLPRYRYLLEWMIARVYIHHPGLKSTVFEQLSTKDHHSNPKFLASLMKTGVMIAKCETSDETFAFQLATTFVPLAASSKVIIRHEAQWQVPILLGHARSMGWHSVAGNTAFNALDQYIRSLERFGDPPLERQIDKLDPITDHNFTNLVEGPWYALDRVEQRHCRRADFVELHATDSQRETELPPTCMPLGDPIARPEAVEDTIDTPTNATTSELTLQQNINTISHALGSGPGHTALQTKGAAYLESSRTRFTNLLVVASLVDNPYNLGGLSRVSEIFGAGALYLPHLNVTSSKDFTNVSVASHQHIPLHALPAPDLAAWLAEKKRGEGYSVVGIEQTDRSVLVGEEGCVLPEKCVVVIGSEREGIPAAVLSECNVLVEIRQVGITRSLNVQTAAGIVLCEYVRQRRVGKE